MRMSIACYDDLWSESWTPPADLNPWQWVESNIEFTTRVSPIKGPVRTDMVPYIRYPLEAFADPAVRRITLNWAAQTTKTTTAALMICYAIANDPGNALFVRPSLTAAKAFSEGKLVQLINHNPALKRHKTDDRYDFQKTQLQLDVMTIFIRGANPNQLSAESCKIIVLDETDKFPVYSEANSEADLVSLAFERLKFFRNSKGVMSSTPTLPSGIICRNYDEGTRSLFQVPCPRCGVMFAIEWENVKWPKECDSHVEIRAQTYVECPSCKGEIRERDKFQMCLSGLWVPQNPTETEHVSLRLPEMYSPVTKWGDMAVRFLKANDQAKVGFLGPLHNFINSGLALPWNPDENKSRKIEEVTLLRDSRPAGRMPESGALGITFSADSQDLGFWYEIRAFGRDLESWLLIEGYMQNAADLIRLFETASFGGMKPCFGLWDSGGHRTSEVYDICRAFKKCRASKGMQKMNRPWRLEKQDQYPDGKAIAGGLTLALINTTYFKDMIAGKIALGPAARGGFHLHGETSQAYLEHITAEYRDSRGLWRCPEHKRNDLWDCTVLTHAAADMIGLRWWKDPNEGSTPRVAQAPREDDHENKWLGGTGGWLKR
jgi:terminase, large subunit